MPEAVRVQRRYLALWFPFLATDRVWRLSRHRSEGPDETPLVLIESERGALRIAAADGHALALGTAIGMTLADARARVPLLAVAEMDRRADAELLTRLTGACELFTPLAAPDPPDGILLDITGCAGLFSGESGLRQRALQMFVRRGLAVQASIAGTPDAARALARFGTHERVEPGGEAEAVRPLPVAALGLGAETLLALNRAGLRIVADLADRPSKALAARFGRDLSNRLARLLGHEDLRITPLRPMPDCMSERHFSEPLADSEGLLRVLDRLARDMALCLERRGMGGRLFELGFFRSDGAVRRIGIETAQACREPASLIRLIRLRLDTLASPLDPGFGFDAVRLSVLRDEPLRARQTALDGTEHDESSFSDLIDRLTLRFGHERVLCFVAGDSHDPGRAGSALPFATQGLATQGLATKVAATPWLQPEPDAEAAPARPLTLFEPPQAIEALAEVPDGPPLRFRWRRMLHEIARAEGPERIAPEWWRVSEAVPVRDYYRLEDREGRRFWVFREGFFAGDTDRPRWFLHGLFA